MRQCVDLLEFIDTDLGTNLRRIEFDMPGHGHGMVVVNYDMGLLGFVPQPNLLAIAPLLGSKTRHPVLLTCCPPKTNLIQVKPPAITFEASQNMS